MIEAIIFDLDGVLIDDTKKLHFDAFNYALFACGLRALSKIEHDRVFDGLPTSEKIKILREMKWGNISEETEIEIRKIKADYTREVLKKLVKPDAELIGIFRSLKNKGFKLGVASNAVRETVKTVLSGLCIIDYIDVYLSNEDVKKPKPDPEIYLTVANRLEVKPSACWVYEDNNRGLESANSAGCNTGVVSSTEELKESLSLLFLKPKEPKRVVNVVIPMAGEGSRFEKQNYSYPKPLVAVGNKPMIEVVYDTLPKDTDVTTYNYTYIVRKEHDEKYSIFSMLHELNFWDSISLDTVTEGALCTALTAKKNIDNDSPLIIANSDQYIKVDWDLFYKEIIQNEEIDGAILTFDSIHPKFSYVAVDSDGDVRQIFEKRPVSRHATCGVYYFRKGSDFVKYAERMVSENNRTLGEFYLAPVYNYFIRDKKKIVIYPVDVMMSLGTPEDLQFFLQSDEYTEYVKNFGL